MARVKASSAQLNHLINFMKVNHECAAGRGDGLQGKIDLERQWQHLANTLNALGGPVKTVDKWKQTWRDLRSSVKKKAMKNKKEYKGDAPGGTGNGPSQLNTFTAQDEAVMSVMGPVAIYGMDNVACTMPVEAETCSTEILEHTVAAALSPTPSVNISQDEHALAALAPVVEGYVASLTPVSSMPGPSVTLHKIATTPARPKMRSRRRPNIDTFDSQILAYEKESLELKKKKIDLQERQLLVKEAKVKALERIATALEAKNNNYGK